MSARPPVRGRGVADSPTGRFERLVVVYEDPGGEGNRTTEFLRDRSRRVLAHNESPDVPFEYSLNPYRGCEHGCSYCYARPTHEFLGFSAGLDFETKILVKEDAPGLLRAELSSPSWRPQIIAFSGVTDPYQPVERRIRLTRRCLEVLLEFRNPVGIITKNHLVTRDVDLLTELSGFEAASVILSVTTLDVDLARRMEPRASHPGRRLAAIERLAEAGIPVGVNVAPVIPGLTDYEIPAILRAAADAGASFAGFLMLRLPHSVKDLFSDWLEQHRPNRKHRVLQRIRDMRAGGLNDTAFGRRMRGTGLYAEQIARLFEVERRKVGLERSAPKLSARSFIRPGQIPLF